MISQFEGENSVHMKAISDRILRQAKI